MTNYSVDELLNQNSGQNDAEIIRINLLNSDSNTPFRGLDVYLDNTMEDILRERAIDIGVDIQAELEFMKEGDRVPVIDRNMTVAEMGLHDGDTLAIRKAREIRFAENKGSRVHIKIRGLESGAYVCNEKDEPANVEVQTQETLGEILLRYAKDIRVDSSDPKVLFRNDRTMRITSDKNETVGGFELCEGDTLSIQDNAGVA